MAKRRGASKARMRELRRANGLGEFAKKAPARKRATRKSTARGGAVRRTMRLGL